ncbi:penicillin-binding transpeptidase domain-containing protein [Carnobacterium sp. ISL-102]|uniref:penicillin-binding transpeptidase domain-containing protein n=1 Tax=Carnobacterium TaxID=2747 RepID=UPI001BE77988|nr:penicillin-binding transpeptidase domain-containing protein [Carnobacterium sp. ISL-102]MBT2732826.1 penicillin-binding protein [Carnobacterium sp. ISL-102]
MNNKNPLKNRKKVAILLFFGTIFLLVVFAGRIAFIMVKGEVNGENLSQNLNNLYTRSSILEANRGTIYDVGGESVALDATSYSLVAVLTDEWSNPDEPQHVVDKKKTAELLEKFIPMSKQDILATLNQKNLSQVEFGEAGKNLSFDTKKSIEQENLPGIVFEETPTRLYPNGIFASHLVGYAALPSGEEEEASSTDLTGMMGIELAYDDLLKGTDGKTIYQKDSFGYVIPNSEVETTEPVNGDDIYLTIDKRMQVYMENVMSEIDEKYNSAMVTATLINPETGAIIATSQRPTFNGTTKVGIDQLWQNLLVENTFEPGSTIKILTLAAAVSEGVFDPNAYYQSGVKMIGKEPIHDHDPEGWGTISYLEGLARSSNVAFANLMEKMSPETWKEYMDAFGLGQTTNSGLANEAKGSIGFKYPLEQANTAFGQGLTVTAVQMLQAFTAIANDGQMMKPQYISKFVDSDTGKETIVEPEVVGEPITEEVAHQTLEYLKEVVYNENGTGVGYQIDGYEIAAKTGTAEIVNPETKQYYSGGTDYIYSVAAMAPADDPKVILYITVQQPEIKDGSITGSGVVKEIYQPIMKRALEYLSLGEEEDAEINAVEMPKVTGTTKEEALKILEDTQLNVTVVGNGDTIVQQLPLPNKTTIENQRVVLMTNGAMTMPDMMGWSKNDVLKVSEITGLEFTFEGEGYVESQSLEPNANMHDADKITIGLETP